MGYLLAATTRSFDELIEMDPIERDFMAYWIREREYDQMQQLGRLLGVFFNAGEVRGWKGQGETGAGGYDDTDNLLVPLSFMLRPEARDGIQKMVGSAGLALPKEYKVRNGEIVVDLGQVDPKEFIEFVNRNRVVPPEG